MPFIQTIDREKFIEVYKKWECRKITIGEAMESLGIKSRMTWYHIKKELQIKGRI